MDVYFVSLEVNLFIFIRIKVMKLSLVCIFVLKKKCLLEKDHSHVNIIIYLIKQLLFQDAQVATIFFLGLFWGDLHIPCIVDMEK